MDSYLNIACCATKALKHHEPVIRVECIERQSHKIVFFDTSSPSTLYNSGENTKIRILSAFSETYFAKCSMYFFGLATLAERSRTWTRERAFTSTGEGSLLSGLFGGHFGRLFGRLFGESLVIYLVDNLVDLSADWFSVAVYTRVSGGMSTKEST